MGCYQTREKCASEQVWIEVPYAAGRSGPTVQETERERERNGVHSLRYEGYK